MKKIAIFCTEYHDNSGGIIVMHYLCHLLRGLGVDAYMFPRFGNFLINFALNNDKRYLDYLGDNFAKSLEIFGQKKYKTNPSFDTPVIFETPPGGFNDDWVVIYPENTLGNPLSAKNIVRWLLAPPLEHQPVFSVNKNEYLVKHGAGVGKTQINDVYSSERYLNIQYLMEDVYNQENISTKRNGTAYCLRKGKGRKIVHELNNSICIDGLSHAETAVVFKKVETFISYDVATFYSQYAVMCGANSVVVPQPIFTTEQWREMPGKCGIAYGFEELSWAADTKHLLKKYYLEKNTENIKQCSDFIQDIHQYFSQNYLEAA